MSRYFIVWMIWIFAYGAAQTSNAQTAATWNFGYADAGYSILACAADRQIDTTGRPYQTCLNIYCEKGYGVSFGLGTGLTTFAGPFTANLFVDGSPRQSLAMTPQPNGIEPYSQFSDAAATEFFRTLSSGKTLSLLTNIPGTQPPGLVAFPLTGAGQAVGAMNAECLLGQPNGSVALLTAIGADAELASTPETDPARFVKTSDVAQKDGRGMELARALLAARIGQAEAEAGRTIEVLPELVPFQDGRQLLIVYLCDPTWFGITGCETWMYTARAGANQFDVAVSEVIGGGPIWLDLKSGVDGWPDMLSQPFTANGAFVRSRWGGTKY